MGLWDNIEAHADLINTYSYTKEVMEVIKNGERTRNLQLVTAHYRPGKNYRHAATINMNNIREEAVHFNKC